MDVFGPKKALMKALYATCVAEEHAINHWPRVSRPIPQTYRTGTPEGFVTNTINTLTTKGEQTKASCCQQPSKSYFV